MFGFAAKGDCRPGFSSAGRRAEDFISFAQENGFQLLELDFQYEGQTAKHWNAGRTGNFRKMLEKNRLAASIHLPWSMDLAERLEEAREFWQRHCLRCMRVGEELGALWYTAHLGQHYGYHGDRGQSLEWALEGLAVLADRAGETGAVIAVENLLPTPEAAALSRLGSRVEDLEAVFRRFPKKTVRFCWDPGHGNISHTNGELLEKFSNRLLLVHCHDNHGVVDEHLACGRGKVGWPGIMKKLREKKLKPNLILEVFDDEGKKESKKYLESLLSR